MQDHTAGALEATEAPVRPVYAELGVAGTRGARPGRFRPTRDEQNAALKLGRDWIATATEMLRTDAVLAGAWRMMRETLLSARFEWRPADGSAEAARLAEYANQAFGFGGRAARLREPWEAQLARLLHFVPLGYRYAEEVYYVDGGRVWLSHLADREPLAHSQWLIGEDGSTLAGVEQIATGALPGRSALPRIPASKLLVLSYGATGLNYEGVGLLRAAYGFWRLKDRVRELSAIATERWAVPTPRVTVDREAATRLGYPVEQVDALVDAAAELAERYVSHEAGWLVDNPAVQFTTYGDGALDLGQPLALIALCNTEMLTAMGLQFLAMGLGSEAGSRNIGEVHESTWRRTLINVLDLVCGALSGPARPGGGTLARLIRWNFGAVDPARLPRLAHEGLDRNDFAELVKMLPNLGATGFVTPTTDLEQRIRAMIGADPVTPTDRPPGPASPPRPLDAGAPLPAGQAGPGRGNEEDVLP